MIVRLVLALYLLSGFTSLVYEVIWTRQLTLILGSTVYAVSTILAVFMAGLALGSYLAGRLISRQQQYSQKLYSPLVLYGLLEGTIGLYAFVLPTLLNWAQRGYLAVHTQSSFIPAFLAQSFIAACLLLPPTILMGATFPLMCQLLKQEGQLGRVLGRVYGINTAGAVIGTIAAGFFLIPVFGVKGTVGCAITINFFICVSSFFLSRFFLQPQPDPSFSPTVTDSPGPFLINWRIFLALGLSGFALMAYEILWTRTLLLIWPSTTYAFSTMLAVILTGLAVGSTVASWIKNRFNEVPHQLCFVQAGIASSAIVGLIFLARIPANAFPSAGSHQNWGMALSGMALESFLLMIIPAVLTGMVYPLAGRLFMGNNIMASHVAGLLYAIGTLGGVLGSVFAGFILLPIMGLTRTFIFIAWINLLSGVIFLVGNRQTGPPVRVLLRASTIGLTGATAAIGLFFFFISPLKLSAGFSSEDAVLYHQDGTDATVAVYREKISGDLVLQVNSQVMARTNHGAMVEQKLRGHIPVLVHPHPKTVLQVGLGSGITLAAMAAHPLDRMESAEISQKVIEAASFFSDYNHGVLSDPKVAIIKDDGRNHLLLGSKKYDIVISDSQPPWSAGIVNLYTQEYYRLVASRLNEDGTMSQMVPVYGLSLDQIKTVIRTFQSVFPYTSVWLTYGELLILGQKKDIPMNFTLIKNRLDAAAVSDDLKTIFRNSPSGILRSFVLGWKTVKTFVGEGPVITDSYPTLEFTAPKTFYQKLQTDNTAELNRRREEATDYLIGLSDRDSREVQAAQQADILYVDGRVAMARNDLGEAVAKLTEARKILSRDDEVDSMLSLSHFGLAKKYFENGLYGNAQQHIEKALAVSPRFLPARYLYAELLSTGKDKGTAKAQYEEILRQNPASAQAYLGMGEIFEEKGNYKKALEQYQSAVRAGADDPKVYQFMARVHYKQKEYKEAASLLETAMQKDPEQNTLLYHLAETYERLDCSKAKNTWNLFLSKASLTQVDQEQVKEIKNHLSGLADGIRPCSNQ